MRVKLTFSKTWIHLGKSFVSGGEGDIHEMPNPRLLAKVYHEPKREYFDKLVCMLREVPSPYPAGNMPPPEKIFVAWPLDVLENERGDQIGFLMPRAAGGSEPITEVFDPQARREKFPRFTWMDLHGVAYNLAAAFDGVHSTNQCVVGDVNESNVLVSPDGLVTIIDCDSFQVRGRQASGSSRIFRCRVGKPEYIPPELRISGLRLADIDRTVYHDRFGLAVLIWQLLMSTHPFDGIYTGDEEDPPLRQARIREGHFMYGGGNRRVPYKPIPHTLPFFALHETLRDLFVRSFRDGHAKPSARPSANEWGLALQETEGTLIPCGRNNKHFFSGHLRTCPWCLRRELFNIESFP